MNEKRLSSQKLLIIGAVILGCYLALILTVASLGQTRLKESQQREIQLKIESYATDLDNFFTSTQEQIDYLAKGKSMQTFFANLAAGMSYKYGLGASLNTLTRDLSNIVLNAKVNEQPIYSNFILTDYAGKVITATEKHHPQMMDVSEYRSISMGKSKFYPVKSRRGVYLKLVRPIQYEYNTVGFLLVDVNNSVIIELATSKEYSDTYSRMILQTDLGDLFIWDSFSDNLGYIRNYLDNSLSFEIPIAKTNFKLKTWVQSLEAKDVFTSRWFVVALAFLSVPVIAGLYYIFKINSTNLVLRTTIAENNKKKLVLEEKNNQLLIEIDKRRELERLLAYQATHDALTGLVNRKVGNELLESELMNAKAHGSQLMIMFIDLDSFKQINDTLGHLAGDKVLRESTKRILSLIDEADILSRFGGDEFLLIKPNLISMEWAREFAKKILDVFSLPFSWGNKEFFISISIGISIYPDDAENSHQLLANADTAMYKVKESGRNAFHFYSAKMNIDLERSLALDSRLRQALTAERLQLYYQPIIDLKTQKIVGAEALMRWHDEQFGFVAPDEFIPLAEKNGLIHQLGEFALNSACLQAAQWQSISPIHISINVSSVQFRYHDKLFELINSALAQSGLPPEKLDIEITESLLFDHDDGVLAMLEKLRSMGTLLTIDDFGTGYSALSYLQKFPFDRLKIDRTFTCNLGREKSDRELVSAIIAMAKALHLHVVAEGIETQEQFEFLAERDCEYGQGYLFMRPIPVDEFTQLLLADQQHDNGHHGV
ncbi:bifunctional diguanylate cyclase/phosphodiesterase [Vibrio aphrogenes]|uniref:bifunctional diguanylate cyclase/phosphodiesterase n=1 Tax=Vibrio aphrogenes TaxID=1891186 RepID=UPI000B34B2CC|nr:EAL domain-containing protein [Vibrio aphrogenes]